jgi:tRNA A-37 threonylcarbamoyl transferase component Bud32
MDRIGRYKIVRELGRGAMGIVFHAIDPNIGRPVAIKTIQFGTGRKPEELNKLRERLFREARSAGMLSHPGIVTIYDVEQQGEVAYIAMEYVDGPTLDQVLSEPEPILPARMFNILAQTAAALDYAHSKGLVHRDIKPANIMLAADGTAKIADFGIAKVTASEHLTMTGSIVGTPHYMSPEQVQGQAVDGRSDQFSLAVIAFEMLTGEKPYNGEHLTTVVYKIVAEEPVPPHRLNPGISGALEVALSKALAKKPDARYRNCQEFVAALETAGTATKGWNLMPRGGVLNAPTVADVAVRPAVALPPPHRPRRADTATGGTAVKRKSGFLPFLLAVLVAGGLLALISRYLSAPVRAPRSDQPKIARPATKPPERTAPPATAPLASAPAPEAVTPPVTPSVTQPPAVSDPKPSPVGPPTAELPYKPPETRPGSAAAVQPAPKTAPRVAASPAAAQQVLVVSSPGGATATLDGNSTISCITPCTLDAAPGRHTVSFALPGYQLERREVTMGTGPQEVEPVVLRSAVGTLMLQSMPVGATVTVDGHRIPQVTPAQITLAVGVHTITVEKDGKQATEKVEIKIGIKQLRIPLGQ